MMTGRIRRPGAQLWKLFWDAPISTVFYGFLRVSGMVLRLWEPARADLQLCGRAP